METKKKIVCIPLGVADLLNKVYLPSNPNKLRTAHPSVIQAVRDFKEAIRIAESADDYGRNR